MSKRKKDPSTIGLTSSQVEGQGTTGAEVGNGTKKDSARRKNKK